MTPLKYIDGWVFLLKGLGLQRTTLWASGSFWRGSQLLLINWRAPVTGTIFLSISAQGGGERWREFIFVSKLSSLSLFGVDLFRWWGKVEGIYLIGSRLRSTSLSFFCRQIASFHFPDYEVQKTHKVHIECQVTSICDSFHFCQIEFSSSTLPKISISIKNWEKWLRFSVCPATFFPCIWWNWDKMRNG